MCRTLASSFDVHLIAVHPSHTTIDGVTIHPFKRYHNRKFRIAFGWLIMFFKAARLNAKVYHLHDPELIPCGLLLKWVLRKKVILDIHENIAEDIFDKPWIKNQKLVFSIFTFFEKLACKSFHIMLAENSYEKRYHLLSKDNSTILNYCEIDFFKPFEKKQYNNKLQLYYIGIVLENRGILQIAETLNKLLIEGYETDFHCVGELYSDLERKLRSLPYYPDIQSHLHFHGRMKLEEGYRLAEQMDIGLCIIWPMKNSMESYPTKLFEYMAVGLPVITSNFPLYQQTIEGNGCGLCVDPFDTEKLKTAILEIHNDVKKSELMVENGKKAVREKYDWKSQIPLLMGVYKRLLE